jgi:transcriptional regulator with XRE-family HTH domain
MGAGRHPSFYLRQQKHLTQEQLAEYCEVSARTIQRIESGEVEPRSFTRNSLSNILEFDFGKDNKRRDTGTLGNLFTLLPPVPLFFLAIFTTYQGVVNAYRALSEKPVRYALSIPFVK